MGSHRSSREGGCLGLRLFFEGTGLPARALVHREAGERAGRSQEGGRHRTNRREFLQPTNHLLLLHSSRDLDGRWFRVVLRHRLRSTVRGFGKDQDARPVESLDFHELVRPKNRGSVALESVHLPGRAAQNRLIDHGSLFLVASGLVLSRDCEVFVFSFVLSVSCLCVRVGVVVFGWF